jgi:hypothetical protein
MKLPVMQLSPPSRQLIPLQSKYPPQHPVLKHPQEVQYMLTLNSKALSNATNLSIKNDYEKVYLLGYNVM